MHERRAAAAGPLPAEASDAEARIFEALRGLRPGEVTSYGALAARAGLPRRARLAARVLARSGDATLPWHRVVRADGRIAFPEGSAGWHEQVARLRAEGIDASGGRVVLSRAEVTLDAALWAPADRL